MEVYIDDIVVKSVKEDHLRDLGEVFTILLNYNMKLNIEECSFGWAPASSSDIL